MQEQLILRAATDHDADRLAAFLNMCTLAHQGVARSSHADARAVLHEHGADPATDSRVALTGAEIVGLARVWEASAEEVRLYVRTHPEAIGRGIGTALLAFCESRARELSRARTRELTTTSWAADDRAPELLAARAFSPVRHFLKMRIAAGAIPPRGAWPVGIRVDPFSSGTVAEDALYRAWRSAFAGHWGRLDQGAETFWEERRDPEREVFPFDPALWFVISRRREVVGFSLCELNGELGRIAELGVVNEARGEGLGYALLTHSFHELRARGAHEIVLDVDVENVTSALRLYRKAGMTPEPSFTIWGKEIQGFQR
jgi:mycothiol synthase